MIDDERYGHNEDTLHHDIYIIHRQSELSCAYAYSIIITTIQSSHSNDQDKHNYDIMIRKNYNTLMPK